MTPEDTLPPVTSGSLLVAQFDFGEKPIMAFGDVPIPDDGFPEMTVRYPTLDVPFDVLGSMGQLTP